MCAGVLLGILDNRSKSKKEEIYQQRSNADLISIGLTSFSLLDMMLKANRVNPVVWITKSDCFIHNEILAVDYSLRRIPRWRVSIFAEEYSDSWPRSIPHQGLFTEEHSPIRSIYFPRGVPYLFAEEHPLIKDYSPRRIPWWGDLFSPRSTLPLR